MSVVVDIGCVDHGVDSINYLIERFHPADLYGFDPWPGFADSEYVSGTTTVHLRRSAAWTHDGEVAYMQDGTGSHAGEGTLIVPCFDFAGWLGTLNADSLIVKIDAEGAEYPLLERLISAGLDRKISLLLVEWHDGDHDLPGQLACPYEEWDR